LQGWSPKPRKWKTPDLNWRYLELETAHYWGLTPFEFDAKEPNEKAEMMAFNWVQANVEAYHYEMSEAHAKMENDR